MASSSTNNPPGVMLPTVKSYTPGAGNPRDSAMMAGQNMNTKQNALNSSVGGSRRKFRGGAAAVAVPTMAVPYNVTNGPGTGPNDQIAKNTSHSMQSQAWSADDSKATSVPSSPPPVGGSRKKNRKHKGGYMKWGCYSGGKRRSYRRNNSKKKNKRKTKRHSRH